MATLLTGAFVLSGCPRQTLNELPTLTGTPCAVSLGDAREHVLLRCGPPCGGGAIAPDLQCDIYGPGELCYRDGHIVTLKKLGAWGDRFPWCGWSEEEDTERPLP